MPKKRIKETFFKRQNDIKTKKYKKKKTKLPKIVFYIVMSGQFGILMFSFKTVWTYIEACQAIKLDSGNLFIYLKEEKAII